LSGATDTKKAALFAPLSDTPTGRMVRNHELAHARITPRTPAAGAAKRYRVTMDALQWAEDNRVGWFLDRRELVDADAITDAEADAVAQTVGTNERGVAGLALVTLHHAAQWRRIRAALERRGIDGAMLDDVERRVWCMAETAEVCAMPRRSGRGVRGIRGRRAAREKIFGSPAGFKKYTIPLARAFDTEFPPGAPPPSPAARAMRDKLRQIKGAVRWAPISDVFRPPLNRHIPLRRAPSRRYSDCGVIPSAVHRLPVDGAVFTTKRPVPGGTVLCDASGSMNYADADIDRIIREAPGSTVAFYAGCSGQNIGRIVVAAERGRACAVETVLEAMPGGDNHIDGPALRWLAAQPGPRFWVSDEQVGGVTDFGIGSRSWDECRAICRAAGITIVHSIGALRR
jgi:hypothetical protein